MRAINVNLQPDQVLIINDALLTEANRLDNASVPDEAAVLREIGRELLVASERELGSSRVPVVIRAGHPDPGVFKDS